MVPFPMRWAQSSANLSQRLGLVAACCLDAQVSALHLVREDNLHACFIFFTALLNGMPYMWFEIARVIALRLCTVSGSLMFMITSRCVCADSCLTLYALYVAARGIRLAATAALLIGPFACFYSFLFLISLATSSVALPASAASFAAAPASSAVWPFYCMFTADC